MSTVCQKRPRRHRRVLHVTLSVHAPAATATQLWWTVLGTRDIRRTAGTTVSLCPNQMMNTFFEQLGNVGEASNVCELDLTNCNIIHPNQRIPHIYECTHLLYLRCLACAFEPSDLLTLKLLRLPHVAEVVFSLVFEMGAEAQRIQEFKCHCRKGAVYPNLRRIYVEVAYD
ncbi:hypothetical protein HPB52_015201 [Rhipicephalus sanguineus]|uniref:Uncharacterized protein n=1 Tax=Rhipicephalus sanguineus TaxID=34632 RepID=A0A9D4SWG5_RHISA|nr:hypothetical protein HPB52_015201 [Rhipicephalus sanguineus]